MYINRYIDIVSAPARDHVAAVVAGVGGLHVVVVLGEGRPLVLGQDQPLQRPHRVLVLLNVQRMPLIRISSDVVQSILVLQASPRSYS